MADRDPFAHRLTSKQTFYYIFFKIRLDIFDVQARLNELLESILKTIHTNALPIRCYNPKKSWHLYQLCQSSKRYKHTVVRLPGQLLQCIRVDFLQTFVVFGRGALTTAANSRTNFHFESTVSLWISKKARPDKFKQNFRLVPLACICSFTISV